MTNLLLIIQTIMKCQKANSKIDLVLKDGKKYEGYIQKYTGQMLMVDHEEISVNDIDFVQEHVDMDLSQYVMNRILIFLTSGQQIDAVLINGDKEQIDIINDQGQATISMSEIVKIVCDDEILLENTFVNPAPVMQAEEALVETECQETVAEEVVAVEEIQETAEEVAPVEESRETAEEVVAVEEIQETAEEAASVEEIQETAEEVASVEEIQETAEEVAPVEESRETVAQETIVEGFAEVEPYVPNAFEQGLIDGNKSVVDEIVTQPERLLELGYTEKEIERIKKMYLSIKDAAWRMDPSKIAARIYNLQLDKNGLARVYYEKAFDAITKNDPEYKKLLVPMGRYALEDGDECFVSFWKEHSTQLKELSVSCAQYIDAQLRLHGVKVNGFEKLVINGDKVNVKEYIQNPEKLEALGYSADDIERIGKAFKNANWETSWYKIAVRLFAMQLNKNSLAEIFYEAALMITSKKGEEYTKILNALASVKANGNAESYVKFFKMYKEKLKMNANYCMSYANALLGMQKWAQIEKDMPMLKTQLADNPAYLDKLQTEVAYYKSVPPFVLKDIQVLNERYENEEILLEREKTLLEKLPDRNALKTLLEIYFSQKEEKAYFALVDYALFFIKEDKLSMLKLYTMLLNTEDMENIVHFLPKIPVLWCEADLVKKYMNHVQEKEEGEYTQGEIWLNQHIKSLGSYRSLNAFEAAIVNKDLEEMRKYVESPYLLEELGYSDAETEDISIIDVEAQLADGIYSMRRILAFQGNKNHTAERYVLEAYYENKIDMCNRLFPLLIEEKRGDLILALFDFDRKLNSNMLSLNRFYYLALCMIEKDDEVFFEAMESQWMNYPEDEILDRMISITRKRNDEFLLKQLELQKNQPRESEFEKAIMEADGEILRKYVKNANLLVQLGYTPEEIQKINKIFEMGSANAGKKPGQIANRVYLYQKNKNSLAERLYLNALVEDSPEDVLNVAKALYQIYIAQRNYEMVCKIYEEYLYVEMRDKFNRTYASTYCVALYELERYEDFLSYVRENKDRWEDFNLAANLLYVASVCGNDEFEDYIWKNLKISTQRPDIIAKYILWVAQEKAEEIYTERFADLFNLFFANLPDNDLFAFVKKIENLPGENFMAPKASLLAAMANPAQCEECIRAWMAYIQEGCDVTKKIDILLQLGDVFSNKIEFLANYALELYSSIEEGEVTEYKILALEDYIYKNLQEANLIETWCGLQEANLSNGKGSLQSLSNYLNSVNVLGVADKFWGIYLCYKERTSVELAPQKVFEIVCNFYEFAGDKITHECRSEVVEELIDLSGTYSIDYIHCKKLVRICVECGKIFEADIYRNALDQLVQSDSQEAESYVESTEERDVDYIGYLKKILLDDANVELANNRNGWSKYVVLSEEEEFVIERLRNTLNTAELWVTDEVNIVAKAILCDSTNRVYWKLLQTWIIRSDDRDEKFLGAVLFQLSSQGDKETESALYYAMKNDLKDIALELTLKMLKLHRPEYNISAQRNLRVMIDKGWFAQEEFRENAKEIIQMIGENMSLAGTLDYEWNSVGAAVSLAIASSEYETLLEVFGNNLVRECAKQCCVIIANMILKKEDTYIARVFECLDNSFTDVPYKELVSEFYEISKERELTEAEQKALECIQMDSGNALGVNQLLGFYCDMCITKQSVLGLETICILMKYTPYDPVLYEVAACFLKEENTLEAKTKYYEYSFEYMEFSQSDNPIEYSIGEMVCGETYLREKGVDVKSFYRLVEESYPQFTENAKAYKEFCDTILMNSRASDDEEFAFILLDAVFTGNWVDVLEYKPKDTTVNTILRRNIRNDRINIVDDYYRSFVKSVAVYVMKHSDNMWDIIDNSERINLLWNCIENVGCSYEFFSDVLQTLPEECIEDFLSVWSLDIETLTVYKKFFGKYVLKQKYSSQYARVFNVFVNSRGGDIFSNFETQEFLKSLDREDAIEICQNYEQLYLRPSGPMILATGKSVIKDSDYESNIFSNYLKKYMGAEYYSYESRYERFKKKYELICKMNHISSFEDANHPRFPLNEKRQIFSLRALYYYFSVLSGNVDAAEFSGHRQAEFINAVTIVLSDDTYMSELNSFIAHYSEEERGVLGVILLAEQDRLDEAATTAVEKNFGRWKPYLCARLVASYGKNARETELCKACYGIVKKSSIENCYWIKNYKQAKSIYKVEPEIYLAESIQAGVEQGGLKESERNAEQTLDMVQDTLFEEMSGKQVGAEDIEDISLDMPEFIKEFMNTTYEDKILCDYQKQWQEIRDCVEEGNENQDALRDCAIRIGIALLKRQSRNMDEKMMSEVFNVIRRYSIQDSYIISALHDVLQNYVSGYSELDFLAKSVYEHRNAISHLCYEQSIDPKSRIAQDIEAASILIEILTNIANDLSSVMGDESLKERLRGYQDELYTKTKKISKFRVAVNALGKMIQKKINSINYVPYLVVSHLGTVNADSSKNYNWNEIWMSGAERGAVRGVVLNKGGASAKNVKLSVMINSELRETYTIDEILPGRKIPFVVEYYKSDVLQGEVDWSANASYIDESNGKSLTSNGHGKIKVTISSKEWGLSHVGREKFNTQFAAEGEEFCGRTNELLKLNNLYNISEAVSRYPSLLVTGLRRAGKSSVIKYFKESLKVRKELAPIFVDAQGINGDIANAFFNLVFLELYRNYRSEMEGFAEFKARWTEISKEQDWIGQLPTYFMELSELLGNRKVIFVLDEMENVFYANRFPNAQSEEQFFGMIRSIIQNYQEFVSFIFCGSDKLLTSCLEQKRESQMFQVLQRIYVGRMGINDIRDMFDRYNSSYDIKFGDDAIDAIMYYTNGLIWYTKVIAYNILDQIVDRERIIRDEIHVSDVDYIVEKLISGNLGAELIDLLDNNFGARRKAIIRAMARATKVPNDSVSVDMIVAELPRLNYIDNETGEVLGVISEEEISKHLEVLEKMDFIEKDSRKERAYRFTTELYRLLMLNERKIEKFIVSAGGEKSEL